ncbi:MAG: helix-turn-helix transcriptional regulator [Rhizobiales bacterium]|nr:helix-turn-helix transcriptional regulator [Hyphomicrobiales bacterium]
MAAVFVMPAGATEQVDITVMACMFALTSAEARLLGLFAAGMDVEDAAIKLGVSVATVKTHRTRMFAKIGVQRRADCLQALRRLLPPLKVL